MLQKSKYHKWEIRVKYSNFPFAFGYALLLGAYHPWLGGGFFQHRVEKLLGYSVAKT